MIPKLLNTFLSSVLSDLQQQDLDQISPLHMNAHFTVNKEGLGVVDWQKQMEFYYGFRVCFQCEGKIVQ